MTQALKKLRIIQRIKYRFGKFGVSFIGHFIGQLEIRSIRNFHKPLITALVLIFVFSLIMPYLNNQTQTAQAAWFDASWNYRQKIIIDHNKVTATQTDFPVLIKITDTNSPIFSSKVQDDGDDIRFTGSDETTLLSHEIETYSKTTPELWAWVKIPSLSATADTTIYLYYGNSEATSPSAAEKQAVWSNGYAGVWHLDETGSSGIGDFKDSSPSERHSTNTDDQPINSTGKTGAGQSFNGTKYIGVNDAGFPIGNASKTFSGWIKSTTKVDYGVIFAYGSNGWNALFWMGSNSTGNVVVTQYGNAVTSSGVDVANDVWHRVSVVYNGTNYTIYIDGISRGSGTMVTETVLDGSSSIGDDIGQSGRKYTGALDEINASSNARSADWIATEYANQNSPETFATISGEVGKDNYTYQASPAGWYDMAWGSRQPIVFDHTKVPNTNQTDFPALVKIVDVSNDLWAKAQADGDDILFADTSGNKLAHEIEKYDSATHELWAWVKIPSLLTASDTTIYMYYGKANAPSQQSRTAVWSNGYAGVWHMGETGTNPAVYDSTSNANNSSSQTWTPTASGKVGGAGSFNGSSQSITINDSTSLRVTNLSWDVWVSPTTFSDHAWHDIIAKGYFNCWNLGFGNAGSNTGYATPWVGGANYNPASTIIPAGAWTHLVMTWNGTNLVSYINGNFVQSVLATNPALTGSSNVHIGADFANGSSGGLDYWWTGLIDNVRLSSTARSADWIATEYANQNDPGSFETFGTAETADTFAPNNPSTITALYSAGGSPILNNAGSDSTPYYSWPEPEAAGGATDQTGAYVSGIAGYYSYFGTSCGASGGDPALTRGVLSDTGSGLHYSSDVFVAVPDLTTNQGTYCLRLKTKDNAGNVSSTYQAATYIFDTTSPNAPTFVAVNPAGYSSVDNFDFSWPAATDVAGDGSSGMQGYQYKRGGDSGDSWSATQTAASIADITSYQTGENIFTVRSVDTAGNYSIEVQTTYYFSSNPPSKPTALTATPTIADENDFSFSWTAPAHDRPIVEYGYSINATPTANNLTWTSSTSLAAGPYATKQGENILYLVARDDSGAYSFESASVATVEFNCTTAAPPIPISPSISDSSNRAIDLWALTIKWSAGENQDSATFDHYSIERATDPLASSGPSAFAEIATSTSYAYIDATGLSNTSTYYYRIKAVDNAGSPSVASGTVSRMPTGKYTSPPTMVTEPTTTTKATSAIISWVVNRASTSAVRFGTSESDLSRSQIDPTAKTSQSISLVGLEPGTTYYYQVQSLDADKDYSSESAYSVTRNFTTLPAPTISNVAVTNITLSTADVTWDTTNASNTKVYYGSSIAYGAALPESNESMTTKHTVRITSLNHTTKYHFKIMGADIDGNNLSSDDYIFETLPLPVISSIQYQSDATGPAQAMSINWVTNVPTTSSVEYTPQGDPSQLSFEESQSALVTNHRVTLLHLEDNTDYNFKVSGSDQFGNSVQSDTHLLKTALDTRPAIISSITIETSNVGLDRQDRAQIAVSWKTDEPTTSMVEYGEGISGAEYTNKTAEDKALTTSHLVIIPDLTPEKPHHLRVVSTDKGNNISQSGDHTVIPGDVPKSALQIILQTFTRLFGWLGL